MDILMPNKKGNVKIDDLICYCFGYTKDDIKKDLIKNGRSVIVERITSEKKVDGCDCVNKNPKGKWCLADVRRVVDELTGKNDTATLITFPS